METKIDTFNKHLVAFSVDGVVFLKPPPRNMERLEALTFAAWIVASADQGEWEAILAAVKT